MRPLRSALPAAALLLLSAVPGFAAARLTYSMNGAPTPVSWPRASFPIAYSVDRRVVNEVGQPLVDRAFAAWAQVPDADIRFKFNGIVDGVRAGQDGANTVTMMDGLFKDQGFLAVTTNWYDPNGNMTEADIQVDASLPSTDYNVQQTIEHEIGHLLGLDHSAVLTSMMYPYVSRGTNPPVLDSDDKTAIAGLYPKTNPSGDGGTLTGRVVGNDGAIFAAQVVAVNEVGEAVATSLSDESGAFVLQNLPKGRYRVYAEPLDGPVDPRNLDGVWRSAKVTSFRTTYASAGTMTVDDGTVVGNVTVDSSGAPVTLNPKWLGVSASSTGEFSLSSTPATVHAGETVSIAVAGDGFTSGMTTFEVMNPGVKRISDFRYAANFVWATFSVAPTATSGSAVIAVTSGNEAAMLTGALHVDGAGPGRGRLVRR